MQTTRTTINNATSPRYSSPKSPSSSSSSSNSEPSQPFKIKFFVSSTQPIISSDSDSSGATKYQHHQPSSDDLIPHLTQTPESFTSLSEDDATFAAENSSTFAAPQLSPLPSFFTGAETANLETRAAVKKKTIHLNHRKFSSDKNSTKLLPWSYGMDTCLMKMKNRHDRIMMSGRSGTHRSRRISSVKKTVNDDFVVLSEYYRNLKHQKK